MTTYNRLAARKIIGAIAHLTTGRHQPIPNDVLRRIIDANIRELFAILPRKFGGIIAKLDELNMREESGTIEFAAGIDLILSMIPITYGMLPAGTRFKVADSPSTFTKRKDGIEGLGTGLYDHIPADRIVFPL
jgi:hypothetical protein